MPQQDQLEIISPSGEIEFHNLDPGKGVTNIGRHLDNDIVVDSPGVAAFQAVLDHRQAPYRVMALSDEGEMILEGQRLAPNVFEEMRYWDTIEMDGYALVLLEGAKAAVIEAPVVLPLPVAVGVPPAPEAEVVPGALVERVRLPALPPDIEDEVIVTEILEREWTISVEQTATCQLTLVNGGSIVAAFDVQVEGLDPSWVTISPPEVNLNEGARATINIFMEPPRVPTSRAGTHFVAIVVTSPNYPGHTSRLGATLSILPYYEFSVGELSPKQQTVGWRRRSGEVTLPVSNKSNSEMPFRLEGEDDERGCHFEFLVPGEEPGEEVSLLRQAEMRIGPDETHFVPVAITPIRRRLVALRKRTYSYTLTTAMVEGAPTPRSMMGQVRASPLIGPWLLLLLILLLGAGMTFLLKPNTVPTLAIAETNPGLGAEMTFLIKSNTLPTLAIAETNLDPGEEVVLSYDGYRFRNLSPRSIFNRLNALFLSLTLEFKSENGDWETLRTASEIPNVAGKMVVLPTENGKYRLLANTWISALIPMLEGESRAIPVFVTPIQPKILDFRANPEVVLVGEEVTISWRVDDAEFLVLQYNGIEESLTDAELESGSRIFVVEADTTFTLIASNSSWAEQVQKPLQVLVFVPTRTPMPTPVIMRFDVDPLAIMAGETVRLSWEVTGADVVTIDPLGGEFLTTGDVGHQPAALTNYKLTAYRTAEDGTQVKSSASKEVFVNPQPTATSVPVAPVVQLFEVTPKEVILGDDDVVNLTWSVSGFTTNIEITAPDIKITGLKAQDVITVTPKETTLFVLTAYNGELNSSVPAEVVVLEPTPTPSPTPPPTEPPPPPPTETPFPPPAIAYYKAEGLDPLTDKVVFKESYDSGSGMVYIYEVEAGSMVVLSWSVNLAEAVTLQDFGPQPAEGSLSLPQPVRSSANYMLIAENNGGANAVSAFAQLDVVAPQPPPAPLHLTGIENAAQGTNRVMWSYRPEDREKVIGFRLYRTDVPPGDNFAAVWTEYNPNSSEWTDQPQNGSCGKGYYVVAVYTDPISNEERETNASQTSWYSHPCP
jgi:hypothetical protein